MSGVEYESEDGNDTLIVNSPADHLRFVAKKLNEMAAEIDAGTLEFCHGFPLTYSFDNSGHYLLAGAHYAPIKPPGTTVQ